FAQRDEIWKRLAVYDEGHALRRRWQAPAHLAIASSPPGAAVTLIRFDAQKKPVLPGMPLGQTPLEAQAIDQGSVVLTLVLDGHAPVRLPLLLGRDERQTVEVDLPPAGAVPEDFVYVPRGRFLFGTGEDEEERRPRERQPIHAVETGAYLIARHEVTFG